MADPIVVNGNPTRDQEEVLLRQVLSSGGLILAAFGLTKYAHMADLLAGVAGPALAVGGGVVGLGAIAWGQWKTRVNATKAAKMADALPDAVATTRGPLTVAPIAIAALTKIDPVARTDSRPIPDFLIAYLVRVEGEETKAYWDAKGKRWTIGVGHTGPEVHAGVVFNQAQIDTALELDLRIAVKRLEDAITRPLIWALSETQYAALLSFVFNVGEVSTWHVWSDIRDGDLADVPRELERFVYADGVKVSGLINRRADDVALWNGSAPEAKLAA